MIKFISLFIACLLFTEMGVAQHIQYFTPQVIDFGTVKEDSLLQGSILFMNMGTDPVTIRNVRTGCGCTVAQVLKKECVPGDTMDVSFSFNTKGFSGLVRKSVTILFQESDIENANFMIQANIIQDVDVRPKNFQFSVNRSNPDSTITDVLTIHNYSNNPIEIEGIHESNNIITAIPTFTVIQPGEEEEIKIRFHSSQVEQRYLTLLIETNHSQKRQIFVPVLIDIKD